MVRVAEVRNWIDSGDDENVLSDTHHHIGDPHSASEDLGAAGRNYAGRAGQVFENSDRYVNDALTKFMNSAKCVFDDSI